MMTLGSNPVVPYQVRNVKKLRKVRWNQKQKKLGVKSEIAKLKHMDEQNWYQMIKNVISMRMEMRKKEAG